MTDIYLIRHAEAEGNLYRRIQGRYDSLVTETGKKQIKCLEKRFEGVRVDAVYSSDYIRTRMTAAAVAEPRGLEITEHAGLREVAMGEWEDRTWSEIEEEYPEQLYYYNASPDKWDIPGGERFADLQARILGTLLEIAAQNENKAVAVVSHGGAIRALLAYIYGIPAQRVSEIQYCDNTAVSLLRAEGGRLEAEYINDNSHLPDELSPFKRETWWKQKSGMDGRNIRFLPLDPGKRSSDYLKAYREAWISAHGSDEGFSKVYLQTAVNRARMDPHSVVEAYVGRKSCGFVELAPEAKPLPYTGHIAFLALKPEYRRKGLGVQLIGYAVKYYRDKGCSALSLRVAQENERARQFYEKYGFEQIGLDSGATGKLIVMRKEIGLPHYAGKETKR